VNEQVHFVRVAKLMSELVAATAPPPPDRTPTAAIPPSRAVALNSAKPSAGKPSANKQPQKKTVVAQSPAAQKLAAAKPATGSKSQSKPPSKPEVHVVSAMKDQSRPQSAQNHAKPASIAAAKRIAAQ